MNTDIIDINITSLKEFLLHLFTPEKRKNIDKYISAKEYAEIYYYYRNEIFRIIRDAVDDEETMELFNKYINTKTDHEVNCKEYLTRLATLILIKKLGE